MDAGFIEKMEGFGSFGGFEEEERKEPVFRK